MVTYKCECGNIWSVKCSKKESQQTSTCTICHKKCMSPEVKVCLCHCIIIIIVISECNHASTTSITKQNVQRVHQSQPKRMFGEFHCEACDKKWASAHAWEGQGQQCGKCGRMIHAKRLRPLRQTALEHRSSFHREDLCERCQELGYNCQKYHTPRSAVDNEDDQDILLVSSLYTDSSSNEDITSTDTD